jgi:hypothetical protein
MSSGRLLSGLCQKPAPPTLPRARSGKLVMSPVASLHRSRGCRCGRAVSSARPRRVVGEEFQPYATTYVAVALIAWWAGLGPAIVTILLGLFSTLWVIVPPRNSFAIRGIPDIADILIFLFAVTTIVVLTCLMRSAKADLAKAFRRMQSFRAIV